MARSFVRASTQYLAKSSSPVTDTPMTVAAWVITGGGAAGNHAIVTVGNSTGAHRFVLYLDSATTHYLCYFFNNGATTFGQSSADTTAPLSTRIHLAGVAASHTSRYTYLNGTPGAESTTDIGSVSGVDRLTIGAGIASGSVENPLDGTIYEVGVWNVALTAAEIASLAAGVSPLLVRPESLVSYCPVWGRSDPEPDLIDGGGYALTNAPAYATHGRVLYPRRSRAIYVPSAAGAYTLAAAQGAFTLTGQAATPKAARLLAATHGAFALTGQAATITPAMLALRNGLIESWELEEASGTRTGAHRSLALTDVNTVTQATGKVGDAAQFTKANAEYLTRASEALLQTGDIDFTVEAWVYLDSKAANMVIASKDGLNKREWSLLYLAGSDRFVFHTSPDNSTTDIVTANTLGSPATGTWYHIVAWHDATANTVNISVNGGAADSASTTGPVQAASDADFRIGGREYTGFTDEWDGRIDGVRFWKRTLTQVEKIYLYNGGTGRAYSELGTVGISLTAAQGSFVLTGQSATPRVARLLAAAYGAFTLSGQDATLTYNPAGGYSLAAGQGSFTLAGQDAAIQAARLLSAAHATFTLTGQSAATYVTRLLTGSVGSFVLTGQSASMLRAALFACDRGTFVLTGRDANLIAAGVVVYKVGHTYRVVIASQRTAIARMRRQLTLVTEDIP